MRTFLIGTTVSLLLACGGGGSGTDSVVVAFGIAYVKHPLPDTDQSDAREALAFIAGGDLYYRDLASPSAAERNITATYTGGLGDVKDVEVSYDGSTLLFAMHAPEIEGSSRV